METDVYAFALRDTLNEITNACPDIRSIFLFKTNGDIIRGEEKSQEEASVDAVNALSEVMTKAETLGGLQNLTLEGTKGIVNISRIGDFYLVTAAPLEADTNYIQTLTGVLVRTVLKVVEKVTAMSKDASSETANEEVIVKRDANSEASIEEPAEYQEEETQEELDSETMHPEVQENHEIDENHEEEESPKSDSERIRPEPQASQFIVENIGGLFSPSDVVRVDNEMMLQWTKLYEMEKIEEVTIETFGGKSVQSKLRPMKDAKYEGKGIIQIPERIQRALDVKKGELVRVKPVIE